MKVLVLSFYYTPDLCAGSFRCAALVKELAKLGAEIEVVTTAPNRYSSFEAVAPSFIQKDRLTIHRIQLPSHKSGMFGQAKAFITYYRHARVLVAKRNYDKVYATSSRLFTAFLGARIAKKKRLPLYLDIRDIFVDTMKDILPSKVTWFMKPILSAIEHYTFGDADKINLVSKGFSPYFEARYPVGKYSFFTNGIDREFLDSAPSSSVAHEKKNQLTVLYAGNVGEGQGLHQILPELATRLKGRVQFKIIGDGGQRRQLEQALSRSGSENVDFLPPVSRSDLIDEYRNADILFLHLNNYPAFEKVLPSKIFEYAAMGKPIWAGLSGYSSKFIQAEIQGCEVFSSGDPSDAIKKFERLNLDLNPRTEFVNKFSRENIMHHMALDILELADDDV